jgi:hypothetical protein
VASREAGGRPGAGRRGALVTKAGKTGGKDKGREGRVVKSGCDGGAPLAGSRGHGGRGGTMPGGAPGAAAAAAAGGGGAASRHPGGGAAATTTPGAASGYPGGGGAAITTPGAGARAAAAAPGAAPRGVPPGIARSSRRRSDPPGTTHPYVRCDGHSFKLVAGRRPLLGKDRLSRAEREAAGHCHREGRDTSPPLGGGATNGTAG